MRLPIHVAFRVKAQSKLFAVFQIFSGKTFAAPLKLTETYLVHFVFVVVQKPSKAAETWHFFCIIKLYRAMSAMHPFPKFLENRRPKQT